MLAQSPRGWPLQSPQSLRSLVFLVFLVPLDGFAMVLARPFDFFVFFGSSHAFLLKNKKSRDITGIGPEATPDHPSSIVSQIFFCCFFLLFLPMVLLWFWLSPFVFFGSSRWFHSKAIQRIHQVDRLHQASCDRNHPRCTTHRACEDSYICIIMYCMVIL